MHVKYCSIILVSEYNTPVIASILAEPLRDLTSTQLSWNFVLVASSQLCIM